VGITSDGRVRGEEDVLNLETAVKCATCGQVVIFEVSVQAAVTKSFSFECPNGHSAHDLAGGVEVVDLKGYDRSQLTKVVLQGASRPALRGLRPD
jgi:hypothetical protein